jgi:hypothetical protein
VSWTKWNCDLARLASAGRTRRIPKFYTVFEVHSYLADDLVRRGANQGFTWHFCRPPIIGLEFEMDCRGIETEHVHRFWIGEHNWTVTFVPCVSWATRLGRAGPSDELFRHDPLSR